MQEIVKWAEVHRRHQLLARHPVYYSLTHLEGLRRFMAHHAFAVWDFMSLLKRLQQELTCISLPWRPSSYPTEIVRFINQIVLGEESDVDEAGNPISHFELYLLAMEEHGVETQAIKNFMETLDLAFVPSGARNFVAHNLKLSQEGHVVEVAASFFFGREKLIPAMFESMVEVLEKERVNAPTLLYYLKRHIEVDADEHGPMALKCLNHLIAGKTEHKHRAQRAALTALDHRELLWDEVLKLS